MKKNVPVAEAPTTTEEKEPLEERLERKDLQREYQPEKPEPQAPVPEVAVQKQEVPAQVNAEKPPKEVTFPTVSDIFKGIDPAKLEAAQAMGIPIEGLLLWARGIEVKQDAIIEALKKVPSVTEKGIAEELYKKSMEQRQQMTASGMQPQTPSTGNVGGGGLGGIGAILSAAKEAGILGSGGSTELQDKIMNMALESMGLGNALVKAIILKTAPEMANQLLPPIVPK